MRRSLGLDAFSKHGPKPLLDLANRVGVFWPRHARRVGCGPFARARSATKLPRPTGALNELNTNMNRQPSLTRRQFLSTSAMAATAFSLVPRHVVAGSGETPPSEKINLAGIGVGGQGAGDIDAVSGGNNIVALCDVDLAHSASTFKKYPQAKQYRDFRKMFDEMEKSFEAVVVATPDHCHAVAAMAAIKRGKHVYCEKPLAHSIHEVRELMRAAQEHKVVTQLGNQGHSFESIRFFLRMGAGRRDWPGPYHPRRLQRQELRDRPTGASKGGASCAAHPGLGPLARPGATSAPITRPTCRGVGAVGCPSATGRSAIGPATSWIRSFGRWTWARRPRSRPT